MNSTYASRSVWMAGAIRTVRANCTTTTLLFACILPVQFFCFYWLSAHNYYFTGDGLYYFSRQIHSLQELGARFFSLDELYQYRPLTYVVFSFVLFPLFGANPAPYHLTAYLFSSVNAVLACACLYYWTGRSVRPASFGAIFLILNPVHFFPAFGPTYLDQWLSSFFYFAALLLTWREGASKLLPAALFLLALLSKEHSVMLPFHAMLALLALGVPSREAFRKTQLLWIVLVGFATFQLVIRHGQVFAPAGANPNLQFSLSAARVLELAKGAKPAVFYPENYALDQVLILGRWLRLSFLIPVLIIAALAFKRRPRLALSGLVWFALALAPVAFLRQPPFPRHYYLALPGLAVVFACAVPSRRWLALAAPALALLTISDVRLYARDSWVAKGAQQTRAYLGRLEMLIDDTGRSTFYVVDDGDPNFYWHVDGGAALPHLLDHRVRLQFSRLDPRIDVVEWLNNRVNVIVAHDGRIEDAMESGRFPPQSDPAICSGIRQLSGAGGACSILFRGVPVRDPSRALVETPNRLPVFEAPGGIVTLARTTISIPAREGLSFSRDVRLVPESRDGVRVDIYGQNEASFVALASQKIDPGQRRQLSVMVAPGQFHRVLVRIDPGPHRDDQGDWLVWEVNPGASDRLRK